MPNIFLKVLSISPVVVFSLILSSTPQNVQAAHGLNDEDTILVDKQPPPQKVSYSRIVRKIAKRLFKFDADAMLTFGQGKRNNIARSFSDFADRSKYRLNVKEDEVEVKFSLNF